MTTISNCGHDERGRYSGGKAGDQGGEWTLRDWYPYPNGGWDFVARHPDKRVRAGIAKDARAAALNQAIGYDQLQRETFWARLEKAGYDPAKIVKACEADCSAGVAAIVKGNGYKLGNRQLRSVPVSMYTGNERACLKAAGFEILTGTKYTDSDDYLLAGDILCNEHHHTCINISDGSKAKAGKKAKSSKSGKYVDYKVTAESGLNCRKGPGTNYAITRALAHGTTVHVSKIESGWAKTKTGDWCSASWLERK